MLMRWRLGATEASEAIRSGRMAEINKTLDELTKPDLRRPGPSPNVPYGPVRE